MRYQTRAAVVVDNALKGVHPGEVDDKTNGGIGRPCVALVLR